MNLIERIITIAAMSVGTMITRFLPFLVFPEGKRPPKFINFLGMVLPYAVISFLVVFCLKDAVFSSWHGLPELLAIGLIVAVHRRRPNTLLCISIGTGFYMLLVQYIFV